LKIRKSGNEGIKLNNAVMLKYLYLQKNTMFQIGATLVSEELIENDFVCNLNACQGGCCVEGEAGAPLETDEVAILDEIYEKVKPFLRPEGVESIEKQGTSIKNEWGEFETPLVNNKECAYVIFEGKTAKCGIEEAYNQGIVSWKKPISCHLYPIRVKKYSSFSAVNYHRWDICSPACSLGKELQVPVYIFVKEALIRKFGETWYTELEEVASALKSKNNL
jgi:hypothetical protein